MKKIELQVGIITNIVSMMPHTEVMLVIDRILEFLDNEDELLTLHTNNPDVVNLIEYFDTKDKEVEKKLYLYGELSDIESIFKEFNHTYEIINEYTYQDDIID